MYNAHTPLKKFKCYNQSILITDSYFDIAELWCALERHLWAATACPAVTDYNGVLNGHYLKAKM